MQPTDKDLLLRHVTHTVQHRLSLLERNLLKRHTRIRELVTSVRDIPFVLEASALERNRDAFQTLLAKLEAIEELTFDEASLARIKQHRESDYQQSIGSTPSATSIKDATSAVHHQRQDGIHLYSVPERAIVLPEYAVRERSRAVAPALIQLPLDGAPAAAMPSANYPNRIHKLLEPVHSSLSCIQQESKSAHLNHSIGLVQAAAAAEESDVATKDWDRYLQSDCDDDTTLQGCDDEEDGDSDATKESTAARVEQPPLQSVVIPSAAISIAHSNTSSTTRKPISPEHLMSTMHRVLHPNVPVPSNIRSNAIHVHQLASEISTLDHEIEQLRIQLQHSVSPMHRRHTLNRTQS
jgi:hypothetical protein